MLAAIYIEISKMQRKFWDSWRDCNWDYRASAVLKMLWRGHPVTHATNINMGGQKLATFREHESSDTNNAFDACQNAPTTIKVSALGPPSSSAATRKKKTIIEHDPFWRTFLALSFSPTIPIATCNGWPRNNTNVFIRRSGEWQFSGPCNIRENTHNTYEEYS